MYFITRLSTFLFSNFIQTDLMTPESPSDPHYRGCDSSSSQQIVNTTASSSFSTSITIKANGIDDHTSIDKRNGTLAIASPHTPEETQENAPHLISTVSKRRIRFSNGTIPRSYSFDNGKCGYVHRKSLTKSKTLSSISHVPMKKRCKTLPENGSVDHSDEKNHGACKRRRLFQAAVDQSPLWTTLTHARTISDFSIES